MDDEIKRLFRNGFRRKDIAERLGISPGTVAKKLQRMRAHGEVIRRWYDEQ